LQKMSDAVVQLLHRWQVRWILVNAAGWSCGLLAAALLIQAAGWVGALLAGACLAALAAACQTLVLPANAAERRRWIAQSAFAGLLATLPVYLSGLLALLYLPLGLLLMGALFAAAVGGAQALLLRRTAGDRVWLWVAACTLAGGLCAPLTLSASAVGLPVVCAPGPLLFGIVTAWALPRLVTFSSADQATPSG
jgi:hypothetical protein